LKDPEVIMFLRECFDKAKSNAVVSSKKPYLFTFVQLLNAFLVNPVSDHGTALVDLFQGFAHELVGLYFFSRIDEVEVELVFLSEKIVFQQHFLVNGFHENAFLPTVLELAVIKINLEAGPEDLL